MGNGADAFFAVVSLGLLATAATGSFAGVCVVDRASGAHKSVTTTAGTAHDAKAGAQAPLNRCCSSGTVNAVATDAPAQIASVYRPVIIAARRGKSRLIRPSSSTLPSAMPAPANTDEANNKGRLTQARSAVPMQISSIAPSKVRSTPKRRASAGAGAEKMPRQMMGSVVSKLAPVALKSVSRMMSGNTTDRLPNTGRRLKAISSRLSANSTGCVGRWWGEWGAG